MIVKPKLQFLENFSLQIFYLLLASPFICIQGTDRDKRQETALQEMSKQFSFLHKTRTIFIIFSFNLWNSIGAEQNVINQALAEKRYYWRDILKSILCGGVTITIRARRLEVVIVNNHKYIEARRPAPSSIILEVNRWRRLRDWFIDCLHLGRLITLPQPSTSQL